jgi:hypothetical protein
MNLGTAKCSRTGKTFCAKKIVTQEGVTDSGE